MSDKTGILSDNTVYGAISTGGAWVGPTNRDVKLIKHDGIMDVMR